MFPRKRRSSGRSRHAGDDRGHRLRVNAHSPWFTHSAWLGTFYLISPALSPATRTFAGGCLIAFAVSIRVATTTIEDHVKLATSHSEPLTQREGSHGSAKASNLDNLCVRQLSLCAILSARCTSAVPISLNAIPHVSRLRSVVQMAGVSASSIIATVARLMVWPMTIVDIEREPMASDVLVLSIDLHRNNSVSFPVGFQNIRPERERVTLPPTPRRSHAPFPALVRCDADSHMSPESIDDGFRNWSDVGFHDANIVPLVSAGGSSST